MKTELHMYRILTNAHKDISRQKIERQGHEWTNLQTRYILTFLNSIRVYLTIFPKFKYETP